MNSGSGVLISGFGFWLQTLFFFFHEEWTTEAGERIGQGG